MKRIIVVFVVAFALAAPAFALPDREQTTYYYDWEGNIIGQQGILCGYPWYYSTGDLTGDNYMTELGPACEGFAEPVTCQDIGMNTIAGCPEGFCYSDGRVLAFNAGYGGCF
jgi:hypothetical protein